MGRRERRHQAGGSTGTAGVAALIKGLSVGIDRSNGEFSTEEWSVTGLSGDPANILVNALNSPNIPKIGDLHPFGALLPVSRVEARPASDGSNTAATVTVSYGITGDAPDFPDVPDDNAIPSLEIVTTLQPVTTNFDVRGFPLKIAYIKGIDTDGDGEPDTSEVKDQLASVDYFIPMTTHIYRRREVTNPLFKSRLYTRSIDGDASPIFGEANNHHWIVAGISGDTDDNGRSWKVTYEFQRHPETWDVVVSYIDPETGRPPSDVTTVEAGGVLFDATNFALGDPGTLNTAIYRAQLYPEINFRSVFDTFVLG